MVKMVITLSAIISNAVETSVLFSIVFGIYGNKVKHVNEIESNYFFHRIIEFCENLISFFLCILPGAVSCPFRGILV